MDDLPFESSIGKGRYANAFQCGAVGAVFVGGERIDIEDVPSKIKELKTIINAMWPGLVLTHASSNRTWPTECG